jgi:ATP-dependent protease HslVU (ClpYQ) peptidase subunit
MTCIVGITGDDGDVWLGGDSLGSNGFTATRFRTRKLWRQERRGDPWVLGGTTSYRALQIIRHAVTPPEMPEDDDALEKYLTVEWGNAVRAALKAAGWERKNDGIDAGATLVVGVSGRLFVVQSDWSVLEPANGIAAVGSGEYHAEGAMWAAREQAPVDRLLIGLAAASEFCPGSVAAPYTILHLADGDERVEDSLETDD